MDTSIEDKEITRELWNSRLAVCFQLSEEDKARISRSESLEPLYMVLSRQIYFPCVIEKLHRYYTNHCRENLTDSNSNLSLNNLWLEYENIPLKWHYPVGVLYDLYSSTVGVNLMSNNHLPWQITVHLSRFPESDLLRFPNKESMEAHYMSTLKEADALKHRGQVIGDMQQREHNQLWNSLLQDKYDGFWTINQKLMVYTENLKSFRYIPFRIYILDRPFIQKLFSPYNVDDNKWMTLKDLVDSTLRHEIHCQRAANERRILSDDINDYRVLIHGIQPALNTPIQWLSEHFSYPDNFLHICLIEKRG